MNKSRRYCGIAICFLFFSCANIKRVTTLHHPAGLDSTFHSSEVKFAFSKKAYPIQVFDYHAFSDSLISSRSKDSALTHGIILPASSIASSFEENKMVFGRGSFQFNIHYATINITKWEESSSVFFGLSDLIHLVPAERRAPHYYDKYKSTATPYLRSLLGTIQFPGDEKEIKFYFDQISIRQNFDSADIHGYLKVGKDSFIVTALHNEIPLHGKNVKPMQILQGYSLLKDGSLFAFLQHAPMVKSKDELFINSKAPPDIQMLMSAYFSLVSRLVHSTANERIF